MKNSMYEPPYLKATDRATWDTIFEGQGTQVYIKGQQVFGVVAASTFSDRDKKFNPNWTDFILLKDGSVLTRDVRICIQGVSSSYRIGLSVFVENIPVPPLYNTESKTKLTLDRYVLVSAAAAMLVFPTNMIPTNEIFWAAHEAEAREIAENHAKKHPGKKFHLLKLVGTVEMPDNPVIWTNA